MLQIRGVSKRFADKQILTSIDLTAQDGEVLALLGPSGSGKSTLLYIVAGLEAPDAGQILWDGADLAAMPPHQRGFGLMFQDFALFPHRDVFGNVAFGLEMAQLPKPAIAERVAAALELVGLTGFDYREVGSLSGGEQQRVALARALAPTPRLLMLDEPLGSLDRALRTRLLGELAAILRSAHQSSLYVTHDQEEAYAIADRIAILDAGRLAQIGAPEEIYRRPTSAFVARFLGMQNLFPAISDGSRLQTAFGELPAPLGSPKGKVTVLLRPDALRPDASGPFSLNATLLRKQFRGNQMLVEAGLSDGNRLAIELPSAAALPAEGAALSVSFEPNRALHVFSE
jgi:thiamine transport system ATP-binding protein